MTGIDKVIFRPFRVEDSHFLEDALYHAIYVPDGTSSPDRNIIQHPDLALYISEFGQKKGDVGIIALHDARPIGMAWVRLIYGYGFVDEQTPELSISVIPDYRGQGIGTQLLERLLTQAKQTVNQVSLSVTLTNPAYQLYLRHGFEVVSTEGDSATMVCKL